MPFFFLIRSITILYTTKSNVSMKKNIQETELSYYGLYLLNYLREHRFTEAKDLSFVKSRADRAAEIYEQARREGYTTEGAQELAMADLMRGFHYPKYTLLMEVLEREFDREVPEAKRTTFAEKLLPLIDNVFSIYDLSDDFFAQSPEYDLLYSELTGAVILYLEEYGI